MFLREAGTHPSRSPKSTAARYRSPKGTTVSYDRKTLESPKIRCTGKILKTIRISVTSKNVPAKPDYDAEATRRTASSHPWYNVSRCSSGITGVNSRSQRHSSAISSSDRNNPTCRPAR
ncbi:MAG: hypothetical protein K0Q68_2845 [Moraxellaceae bacterium]|nr:hypothetical protein [Moraxellaceae bacterium]